ncbi:ArsR/SmtB family transcription factor [Ruegeria atlantica]|uniref:ArsR/SmtB family transcription factor n=1 Tax=Ruegeria atlantica TaxID=81569 RepID=UPI00147ED677|nr:metalloregulator ArsR/SmtB family transcription factor [Ruegeria atlantica]
MKEKALEAANLLATLSDERRFKILCHLLTGEKSATELQKQLRLSHAVISGQLSGLVLEGMIAARRDGQSVFYRISDEKVFHIMGKLREMFCIEQ